MRNMSEQPETWHDNWLVKNVLAEIPIIGAFFIAAQLGDATQHALKSSFMLLGGTTVMMLNSLGVDETDSPVVKFTKLTGGMALGMTTGVVLYNTLFAVGKKTVEACKGCHQEPEDSAGESLLPS